MKKLLSSLLSITLLSFVLVCFTSRKAHAQDVSVSYQSFYDELSPYGQWVYDPEYGNVWVPNEGGDFRPYGSRGHWVMTEYGNTWVSEDPWGWACYHYGRWTYNGYYGWIWVPGYEWAPAWVSWRYGGGYSGWAPMAPGVSIGVSYGYPESWWVFVGPQYMYRDNCISYWRGPEYNHECMRRARVIDNVYEDNGTHVRYNYGPRASAIEQVTHEPVRVYRVSQTTRPGAAAIRQNTVSLYRPNVNRSTVSSARPSNVVQAPRSIGKPQAAAPMSATRQPAFRQEMQKNEPRNTGVVGPRNQQPQNNQATRTTPATAPVRNEPGRSAQPQQTRPVQQSPAVRPDQSRPTQPLTRPEQQQTRPQPQQARPQQQPSRPEPQQARPQPQQAPQQQPRQQQQPSRPEPQHFNQQPQPEQQQPRQQPQQQAPRPQPQMQQPRPQPQMQQPRPQPQQAPRPQPQEERGGGRR